MRVFVTGATGFIGSAVVQELLGAGHKVLGLVRSDESAKKLAATGAEVYRGDLEDLESLKAGAAKADSVIHTGFIHDFLRFKEVCDIDKRAIESIGEALEGSNKPLVVSSGVALLSPGKVATEDTKINPDSPIPRVSEQMALAMVPKGVRGISIRLSPSVHGEGDHHGFVPILIKTAREKGVSAYVAEGKNRWPAVHRLDAAKLFRLALEKGEAGAAYHGVADEGVPMKEIAAIIARRLQLPLVSKSAEEAAGHFGWFAHFAGIDCPASSVKTQSQLGWKPKYPGLIADLEGTCYFEAVKKTA